MHFLINVLFVVLENLSAFAAEPEEALPFNVIPNEIIQHHILTQLDPKDVFRFSETSKQNFKLVNEAVFIKKNIPVGWPDANLSIPDSKKIWFHWGGLSQGAKAAVVELIKMKFYYDQKNSPLREDIYDILFQHNDLQLELRRHLTIADYNRESYAKGSFIQSYLKHERYNRLGSTYESLIDSLTPQAQDLQEAIIFCTTIDSNFLNIFSNVISLIAADTLFQPKTIGLFKFLKRLNVRGCQTKELDLKMLPLLEYFDCSFSMVAQLDFSRNPLLKSIIAFEAQIQRLTLVNLQYLKTLIINFNPLNELILSKLPKLKVIHGSNTDLTRVDLSQVNPRVQAFFNNKVTIIRPLSYTIFNQVLPAVGKVAVLVVDVGALGVVIGGLFIIINGLR